MRGRWKSHIPELVEQRNLSLVYFIDVRDLFFRSPAHVANVAARDCHAVRSVWDASAGVGVLVAFNALRIRNGRPVILVGCKCIALAIAFVEDLVDRAPLRISFAQRRHGEVSSSRNKDDDDHKSILPRQNVALQPPRVRRRSCSPKPGIPNFR